MEPKPLSLSIEWLSKSVIPAVILFSTVVLGYIVREALFKRLTRLAGNTNTQIDDIIIAATKEPFIVWCLILGTYFALEVSQLPVELVDIAQKTMVILAIASVTFALASISSGLLTTYSARLQSALPVTSLTQNIARIIILCVGALIILSTLGISITPILATLGVGGLAVALALQETLSNLFSGFHIVMARQIKLGDYLKLESGEEGYVVDINWRTTKIKMLPNNIVLVPNSKMAHAIVTNYYLPDREMAVLVNMGVDYGSDLKKVEAVTCEVAEEVMKEVTGGVPDFKPFIRYSNFGDFSINFTVIMRAREFVDQYLIKHEFIKKVHERYEKEGIIIPYPIRTINYAPGKAL